jgi:hypothetical protein
MYLAYTMLTPITPLPEIQTRNHPPDLDSNASKPGLLGETKAAAVAAVVPHRLR